MEKAAVESTAQAYAERPWLSHYTDNVEKTLEPPREHNLVELFRKSEREYADRPAFTICLPRGTTGTLTYADVGRMSDQFAAYLRYELGLEQGERVALMMPNCLAYPVAAFGTVKAGCVLTSVNPLYTATEMGHQVADSGAKVLVIIDMFADKLAHGLKNTSVETVLHVSVADFMPMGRRLLVKTLLKALRKVPSVPGSARYISSALQQGARHLAEGKKLPEDATLDNLAYLQYTGGTTGRSKGAMLTHGNLVWNLNQSENNVRGLADVPLDTLLTALPMYHIFAFGVAGFFYKRGAHNVLIPSPRPIDNLKKAFEQFDVNFFPGVNTLFVELLNADWFVQDPPKNLHVTLSGGTALKRAVAEKWEKVIGETIYEGYGLSETSPGLTSNPAEVRLGSIGIPMANTELRIVDDNGNSVPQGETGEIVARGPQVMKGYWNRPEETDKALRNGWFYTGDIGYMDKDGFFFIVDRKKDMVLVSGFNVYPNEIEDVLAKHPDVVDVGVVGVPDEKTGEAVFAFVVPRSEQVTEQALRDYCRQELTAYKVPRHIEFTQELPKTPVGKVLRKDLRTSAERLSQSG